MKQREMKRKTIKEVLFNYVFVGAWKFVRILPESFMLHTIWFIFKHEIILNECSKMFGFFYLIIELHQWEINSINYKHYVNVSTQHKVLHIYQFIFWVFLFSYQILLQKRLFIIKL